MHGVYRCGRTELKKPVFGRRVIDWESIWKKTTFQELAAKVEQTSRLNAFTMFYNFANLNCNCLYNVLKMQ